MLDKKSVSEYLKLVDFTVLDENHFIIVYFDKTDKARFNEMENAEILCRDKSCRATYLDNNARKLILDQKYSD